jgi:hypothetical protein
VSDGLLSASTQFTLTVNPVNDPPAISTIANQTFAVGTVSPPVGFTIGDLETAASVLSLQATSSNTDLLPASAVQVGGSGANRNLVITPVDGSLGSTTVSITVSDGELSTIREFIVTVTGTALETWRFANFGSTANTGTAADIFDADGDGQNNRAEFAAGTDPKNAADVFRVLASSLSGESFSITIPGKTGRNYTLQRSQSPGGPWLDISSSGLLADQREVVLTDPARLPQKGFYRVGTSANP